AEAHLMQDHGVDRLGPLRPLARRRLTAEVDDLEPGRARPSPPRRQTEREDRRHPEHDGQHDQALRESLASKRRVWGVIGPLNLASLAAHLRISAGISWARSTNARWPGGTLISAECLPSPTRRTTSVRSSSVVTISTLNSLSRPAPSPAATC